MPHKFTSSRDLPFDFKDLYDLVLDIEKYPEFLPHIEDIVIISKAKSQIEADMYVKFASFSQNYRSIVKFESGEDSAFVEVNAIEGVFKHLYNRWSFTKEGNSTKIEFEIDFEFSSKLLDNLAGPVFESISKKMIESFEQRAREIYDS